MGQARNSGRRATLDDRKERMAGRTSGEKGLRRIPDSPPKVKGAFGAGKVNRRAAGLRKGGGGGGATHSEPKD